MLATHHCMAVVSVAISASHGVSLSMVPMSMRRQGSMVHGEYNVVFCLLFFSVLSARIGLFFSLRHSQPMSLIVSHSTSTQQFRSSGIFCRRSDCLDLATGQSSVTRHSAATASDNH